MNRTHTVTIIGAGPVGLAAAAALAQDESLSITVVEQSRSIALQPSGPIDARVYAISPRTQATIQQSGAWALLDPKRIAPVSAIEVCSPQLLRFDECPPVSWIIEHRAIEAALAKVCERQSNIRFIRGLPMAGIDSSLGGVTLTLSDGTALHSKLLIGADGKHSQVRSLLPFAMSRKSYTQTALVGNWSCEKPHGLVARQWFDAPGTLALLPLPNANEVSMVWSTEEHIGTESLAQQVYIASRGTLGKLTAITPTSLFPLDFLSVDEPVLPHVVLIGDAAHSIHPLAGQGANLGLQDSAALAQQVTQRSALEGVGDLAVLRRYARQRASDVLSMQLATDGLDALLSPSSQRSLVQTFTRPALSQLTHIGMRIVQKQPLLKALLSLQVR